ncbi:helix-turn-helix domain-containing protein [Actinokineospora enzanensis]|uniref:helix-turn-helix domain-containing protein n=1 Tax=Actinokineospora enzanensis TaxID=155975 RepID=UPI00037966A3|nr:helix-turn-helix transcriptional regulator [Actinokineospora enzanensis]
MADQPDPAVQRLRLGAALRRLRGARGLTQKQAADAMDWSLSKVIRMENGSVRFSTSDVRALLSEYRIIDEDEVRVLVALAKDSRGPSWQSEFKGLMQPHFWTLLSLEGAATRIRQVSNTLLPGLLQTDDYARGLRALTNTTDDDAERLIKARQRRRQLLHGDRSPRYTVILDEVALRRQVGGPGVLADQLRHLDDLVTADRVEIRVVEFTAGAHAGLRESFAVFDLDQAGDDTQPSNTIVFIDDPVHSTLVRDDTDPNKALITDYIGTFDALADLALPAAASARLVAAELARLTGA